MMTEEQQEDQKTLRSFLEQVEQSPAQGAEYLVDVHPADSAEWLQDLEVEDLHPVFTLLATEYQAAVLEHAEESLQQAIVGSLPTTALKEVVEELPSDEAVDVLAQADDRIAEDVLESLEAETAKELRQLAAYDPESAGGVMTTDIVTVAVGARIGDAVKEVKREGEDAEDSLGVFVVDETGMPVGYLSDRALLTHTIHEPVAEAMVEPFLVTADEDQEEAANIISKYGLSALAVIDGSGVLLGVISADDAQDILAEEATEDVHRLVGTSGVQQTRLPIARRVMQRMPLMGVTVVGGLVSARILALIMPGASVASGADFEAVLRYLPLIIGLAGNVGVQSSTILVRAFATGEVEQERDVPVLVSEVGVGTVIGLLCGLATLFFASYMEWSSGPSWEFGFAVGAAMFVAVSWAALLGCLIPMTCRRLGIDPAIVAGPFLITLSDISGVGIYILVARALLGLGGG